MVWYSFWFVKNGRYYTNNSIQPRVDGDKFHYCIAGHGKCVYAAPGYACFDPHILVCLMRNTCISVLVIKYYSWIDFINMFSCFSDL